ncbi:MAG: FtsX-like permease family protein [Flavobacteriales bacterium]|nr:FtsX-like permease family protein [Flavobacteriales bacterium]
MLTKIAWRNVWRNTLRSGVVIASIALGIWAGLFVISISAGLNEQRTKDALDTYISHIQIHNPDFVKDNNVEYRIDNIDAVREDLKNDPDVRAFSERVVLSGMVSSSTGGYGARITGVIPEHERQVSIMYEKIVDGAYFEGISKNPIVIGRKLAEKLNVDVRKKVVLTFQKDNGDIVAGAFRVAGIYKTSNSKADEMNVFIRASDANRLLEGSAGFHEVAVMVNNLENVDAIADTLAAELPNLKVQSWREVSPDLGYADEMMMQMLYIIIGIILMALSFGIVNTMLMAVLERKRELGMLMSVGMNKTKVFFMIVIETVFISLVGGPIGVLLGYVTVTYFGHRGIDLSIVGKGLESFGISAIIYPSLEPNFYLNVSVMVIVAAILSSIYPARKALQLKPAEAVRAL